MPKSPVANGAGNVNMKGKKYKIMRCGCCWALDHRDKELKKHHLKQVKDYWSPSSTE